MTRCPKCKSTDRTCSQPVVDGGVTIGIHVGGIGAAALTVAALGPLAVVPLVAGAVLGDAEAMRQTRLATHAGSTFARTAAVPGSN
jgi:hypothetical protein